MMKTNFEMIRGDTLSFAFEVEFDEVPQKLEKVDFTCKANFDDDDVLMNRYVAGNYDKFILKVGANSVSWDGQLTYIAFEKLSRWI